MKRTAFTLVDLVIALTILAIAIPTLLTVAAQIVQRSVRSSMTLRAARAGQELMEEVLSTPFDELANADANGNWSTTLGADTSTTGRDGVTNESASTRATFDDVDDFNNFSETLAGTFAGFARSVAVAYVDPSALNTPLAIPNPVPANWTPSYKRVVVTITPPVGQPMTLVTLVTAVNFL